MAHGLSSQVACVQEMKAFWLPSQTADHRNKLEKPDLDTVCPASGKKLRLKDLIPVRFTPVPEGSSGRHMDPITHDTFSNSMQLVVLRPTGMHHLTCVLLLHAAQAVGRSYLHKFEF